MQKMRSSRGGEGNSQTRRGEVEQSGCVEKRLVMAEALFQRKNTLQTSVSSQRNCEKARDQRGAFLHFAAVVAITLKAAAVGLS